MTAPIGGPTPPASSALVRRRMQNTPTRDTPAELRVRRSLHSLGLRFRVDRPPIVGLHRRADIVFGPARVAVFIDGCFWHDCPLHGSVPKSHTGWWTAKLATTRDRDVDTDARLVARGWLSVRIWEHEDAKEAAARIAELVAARRRRDVRGPAHRLRRALGPVQEPRSQAHNRVLKRAPR